MKIVIASRKGGVGKSTVTAGLASYFATQGKKVLALDLDPQSNLAFMMGADPTIEGTSALLANENPEPQECQFQHGTTQTPGDEADDIALEREQGQRHSNVGNAKHRDALVLSSQLRRR